MKMKFGKKGLDLIKSFEGFQARGYRCPAHVWTIGYGHTGLVHGKRINSDMAITRKVGEELLLEDVSSAVATVNKRVTVKLNQNEFDALVSFVFNVGGGNFAGSTLLRKLNVGDKKGAANAFLAWNKGGGRVLAGLTRRRQAERKLFCLPVAEKKIIKKYTYNKFVLDLRKLSHLSSSVEPSTALLHSLPTIGPKTTSSLYIKPLKKILKAKGYTMSHLDGKNDLNLKSAVKRYKRAHGFKEINSTIDAKFWKKILKL